MMGKDRRMRRNRTGEGILKIEGEKVKYGEDKEKRNEEEEGSNNKRERRNM
jgi:hypothetical protein